MEERENLARTVQCHERRFQTGSGRALNFKFPEVNWYVGDSTVTLCLGSLDNAMRVVELENFHHSADINFSKRALSLAWPDPAQL